MRAAKIQNIVSVDESLAELQDLKRAAFEDKNHTACAQYKRLEMQALGVLRDNIALRVEERMSDDDLIRHLAGDDPKKAAVLREIMVRDGFRRADGQRRVLRRPCAPHGAVARLNRLYLSGFRRASEFGCYEPVQLVRPNRLVHQGIAVLGRLAESPGVRVSRDDQGGDGLPDEPPDALDRHLGRQVAYGRGQRAREVFLKSSSTSAFCAG